MNSATRPPTGWLTVLVAAVGLAGCMVEPLDPPPYVVLNGTDVTVEVRYLIDRPGLSVSALERLRSVVTLEPGEDHEFGVLGNDDDGCLDAPLVALDPDGNEIDRLPAGTCTDDDVRPTWTITER